MTLDYVYEVDGDTLTIWGGEKGSPASSPNLPKDNLMKNVTSKDGAPIAFDPIEATTLREEQP